MVGSGAEAVKPESGCQCEMGVSSVSEQTISNCGSNAPERRRVTALFWTVIPPPVAKWGIGRSVAAVAVDCALMPLPLIADTR